MSEITLKLKDFIIELTGDTAIGEETPLIESGIIDSINFIELIVFIEQTFSMEYKFSNFQVADFDTISALEHSISKFQNNLKDNHSS